jgi:putative transcriptional regulator
MHTRLRKLRKQIKLTQEAVAEKVDVTKDYISMLERGIKVPGRELIVKLATLYGCSVDYILFGETTNSQFGNRHDLTVSKETA